MIGKKYALLAVKADRRSSYSWSSPLLGLSVWKGIFRNDQTKHTQSVLSVSLRWHASMPVNRHSSSFSHMISHSFQDQLSRWPWLFILVYN